MERIEKLRELVHTTLNKVIWICTEVSDDKQSIDVKINFGSKVTTFSFPKDLIEQNLLNGKDFITMVEKPLETLLESK